MEINELRHSRRRKAKPLDFHFVVLLVRNDMITQDNHIYIFILENGAEFRLAEDLPTLHKLKDVEEHGYAFKASLRNEDRLIEVIEFLVASTFIKLCVILDQWPRRKIQTLFRMCTTYSEQWRYINNKSYSFIRIPPTVHHACRYI